MWTDILIWLVLTVCCGIFYRMGGAGKEGQWYEKILNTKWRDFGCPLCVLAIVLAFGNYHISALVSAVLMFGAMTQYWKGKGNRVMWYHWFVTGLMYAVAWLPYCYYVNTIQGLAYYAIIVSMATVGWSEYHDDAVWEEIGRGAIVAFCAPLLTIGV